MKNKIISGFMFLALLGATANGQVRQPHSLYFTETMPQITQMNPAFQPRANGYVMLPGFSFDLFSDMAVKDFLQKQGNKWVLPIEREYDYNKLRRSVGKKSTMINLAADVDIIGFGFRTNNGYFSFGISEHVTVNSALPSDLWKITENGLPDGTTLDFSPLRAQVIAYKQISIGYSTAINDKLTVGVNVKPMFGQFASVLKNDRFQLNTGAERWEVDAKGNLYTSGAIDKVTADAQGHVEDFDDIETRDFGDYEADDYIREYGTSLSNPGIAFDFGAAYRLNERITVSAALNNLGFISWRNKLHSATYNGKYTFNGLYYDTSNEADVDDMLGQTVDSLKDAVNYTMHNDRFSTAVPPVLYAGATYQLTRAVSAGLMSQSVLWPKGFRQSFSTSINIQPYSFVAFNAGATWQVKGNLGAAMGFNVLLGPLQFYLLADGIPLSFADISVAQKEGDGSLKGYDEYNFIPDRMSYFTMRLGFNLIFGRHGYANRPMLDKGTSSWN